MQRQNVCAVCERVVVHDGFEFSLNVHAIELASFMSEAARKYIKFSFSRRSTATYRLHHVEDSVRRHRSAVDPVSRDKQNFTINALNTRSGPSDGLSLAVIV